MLPQQKRIMKLTKVIFKGFWKSHVKVLGALIQGLLTSQRAGVAAVGRALPGSTSPKHKIKRVNYFLGHAQVDVLAGARRLAHWLIGGRPVIYVSVDWTKVREWPVLVASLIYQGRSLPLFWAAMDPRQMYKSMNRFEYSFFQLLKRHVLPAHVQCILLLDRGFRRVNLLKQLMDLAYDFVVRSGGTTHIKHCDYQGKMRDWITARGQLKELKGAEVRQEDAVITRVVGCWDAKQQEAWILCTNLTLPKRRIVQLYGKRFQIEESFRDVKSPRFGLGMSAIRVTHIDRLEKWLLVVVSAHIIATLLGGIAKALGLDRCFRSNTTRHKPTDSLFTLGLYYWQKIPWTLADFYQAFKRYQATEVFP